MMDCASSNVLAANTSSMIPSRISRLATPLDSFHYFAGVGVKSAHHEFADILDLSLNLRATSKPDTWSIYSHKYDGYHESIPAKT